MWIQCPAVVLAFAVVVSATAGRCIYNPALLVLQEPIPYPMKNNIIDLYGKVLHTFSDQ